MARTGHERQGPPAPRYGGPDLPLPLPVAVAVAVAVERN